MVSFELEDHGLRPGGSWLVLGLSHGLAEDSHLGADSHEVPSLQALAAEEVTHVAIVKAEMASLFNESCPQLLAEIPSGKPGAIVLVIRRPCPWPEAVSDGRIYSF